MASEVGAAPASRCINVTRRSRGRLALVSSFDGISAKAQRICRHPRTLLAEANR
jgi:hypothetical protein